MKKAIAPKYFVYIIAFLGIALSLYSIIKSQGMLWDTFISVQGKNRFMDFFNHIYYSYSLSETYFVDVNACFPPLIYFMYYIFGQLLPENSIEKNNLDVGKV